MLVASVSLALRPSEARAYVRETTRWTTGTPLRWRGGCIVLAVGDPRSPELSWDDFTAAARAAGEVWTEAAGSCGSSVRFMVDKVKTRTVGLSQDGVNAVVFQTGPYCRSGGAQTCDPGSAANTGLHYVDRRGAADDGRLYETDIEVNAEAFGGAAPGTDSCRPC